MFPKKLKQKLDNRKTNNALRQLGKPLNLIDFSSNDYIGFSQSEDIFNKTHEFLKSENITQNGATGSRLISGNHALYDLVEKQLCEFHNSETALIFNSGYDANIGFFSSVPQRGDVILYDEYIHASIRDGISMSNAKAYKFSHNNLEALEKLILRNAKPVSESHSKFYVVTESIFSMDGDSPELIQIAQICKTNHALLIVDEAHAVGVFGKNGTGSIQSLKLEQDIFARIITFGKAIGCHGAAILGSKALHQYLINFSRSFIYTTGLSPHSLATIHIAYNELLSSQNQDNLLKNIAHFKREIITYKLDNLFIESDSSIHCCIISGNEKVKLIAEKIQEQGYNVKPILSPTVPITQERLRFCLHSYNSKNNISNLLKILAKLLNL